MLLFDKGDSDEAIIEERRAGAGFVFPATYRPPGKGWEIPQAGHPRAKPGWLGRGGGAGLAPSAARSTIVTISSFTERRPGGHPSGRFYRSDSL